MSHIPELTWELEEESTTGVTSDADTRPEGGGDFALEWGFGAADLVKCDDDLMADQGLRTAVLLSLFTDRRAEDDDVLPAGDGDRRGWWADELAEVRGDRFGSRLWLLDRAKRTPDVVRLAEGYDRESLEWMIEDRVAQRIDVEVEVQGERLAHAITIHRPGRDPVTFRFSHVWDGEQEGRDCG